MSDNLPVNADIDTDVLLYQGYSRIKPVGTICKCPRVRKGTDGYHYCCNGHPVRIIEHINRECTTGETTHPDENGVLRQNHYGNDRQPWDEILDADWAPEFAAGNVLKYLRRDKAKEHSIKSAQWYYARLQEMSLGELVPSHYKATYHYEMTHLSYGEEAKEVLDKLNSLLTESEKSILTAPKE